MLIHYSLVGFFLVRGTQMFTLKTSSLLKNVPKTLTKVLALTLMVSAPLSLAQSEESVGWPEKEEIRPEVIDCFP